MNDSYVQYSSEMMTECTSNVFFHHNRQQHSDSIYVTCKKFSSPHSQIISSHCTLATSLPDSMSLLQLQGLPPISPFHENQQSPVPRFIDDRLFEIARNLC